MTVLSTTRNPGNAEALKAGAGDVPIDDGHVAHDGHREDDACDGLHQGKRPDDADVLVAVRRRSVSDGRGLDRRPQSVDS